MSFESFPKPEPEKERVIEKSPEAEQKEYQAMIDREIGGRLEGLRKEAEKILSEISSEELIDETKLLAEQELKSKVPEEKWGKMTYEEIDKVVANDLGYSNNIDRLVEQAMRNLQERKMAQQREYLEKLRQKQEEEDRRNPPPGSPYYRRY